MHNISSLLFTIQIGDVEKETSNDFTASVTIRPEFQYHSQGFIKCGLFQYARFDPSIIVGDIIKTVSECDRVTFEKSLDLLRERFSWEYEGIS